MENSTIHNSKVANPLCANYAYWRHSGKWPTWPLTPIGVICSDPASLCGKETRVRLQLV